MATTLPSTLLRAVVDTPRYKRRSRRGARSFRGCFTEARRRNLLTPNALRRLTRPSAARPLFTLIGVSDQLLPTRSLRAINSATAAIQSAGPLERWNCPPHQGHDRTDKMISLPPLVDSWQERAIMECSRSSSPAVFLSVIKVCSDRQTWRRG